MSRTGDAEAEVVIEAFLETCDRLPTARQVADHQAKHPRHAAAIAAIAAEMATLSPGPETAPIPNGSDVGVEFLVGLVSRGLSDRKARAETFPEMVARAGRTVPGLARLLDIDRSVLADVVEGRIWPLPGRRFLEAVANALEATSDAVSAACAASHDRPLLGHARADGDLALTHRTFAESVAASRMGDERKAFWIGDE